MSSWMHVATGVTVAVSKLERNVPFNWMYVCVLSYDSFLSLCIYYSMNVESICIAEDVIDVCITCTTAKSVCQYSHHVLLDICVCVSCQIVSLKE